MRNLNVAARLSLGFGLLLALMLASVAVAWLAIRGAERQINQLEGENIALLNAANAMQLAQMTEAVAIRDFVSLPDVESQRKANEQLRASEAAYKEAAAKLERLASQQVDGGLAALVGRVKSQAAKASAKLREALEQAEQAEYAQAQKLVYEEVRPLQAAIATELRALAADSNRLAAARAAAVREQTQRDQWRLGFLLAAALVTGVAATVLITRGIARPLLTAMSVAERVAGGDLTRVKLVQQRDETGRVLSALGRMQESLNLLVRGIRGSADAVSQASEQISARNTDLAARTEEQAASLEETAASVEELTAIVKQNSETAGEASSLAREASGLAEQGGQAVGEVVQTMQGIQKASRRVSEIVGMMDEIAFQTNLLALNAAVEAARAGEHGRGFGVVAAQVRTLAQRSAEASKDIKRLVGDAVGEADQGAKAAGRAGEAMERMVRVSRDVAGMVAAIAQASEEQRSGIEQVNSTIAQMDSATQSNAGLVQEITSVADALLAQARELVDAASRFRLDQGLATLDAAPQASELAWSGGPLPSVMS